MGKHRKTHSAGAIKPPFKGSAGSPGVAQSPATTDQASASPGYGGGPFLLLGGGYQAATTSVNRGYLYWPTIDTRRQMSGITRYEIARRIQWLYAHFGFARRLVNGMARLLGYLTPQPNTSDEEWNELAFDAFMGIAGSAQTYDLGGKFDFFQSQIQDNISIFRDGDCLGVLTETSAGRARMAYYESHQLSSGSNIPSGDAHWVDGVLVSSRGGAHIGYSVRDGEDPSLFSVIDARNAIYYGNFENRGQVRAISILITAVLNMIDVVETRGFIKHAIKSHARIGTVIEQEMGQVLSPPGGGFAGPIIQANVTMPDGSNQVVNMEAVLNGAQTPKLPPGAKVKVVSDDRPTPNNMEFEKAVLTDCTWAADLSYQTLCDVSGITGPGIRFLNAELKRWIMLRQYPQAKRCNRFYNYAIAKEIKGSRLRQPVLKPGETWWNKTEWIGLAAMDIDGGRTSAATVVDLQSGLTTWLDEWGTKGGHWKKRIRQAVAEVVFAEKELIAQTAAAGLPIDRFRVETVFPQRFAILNALPPTAPDGDPKPTPGAGDPEGAPQPSDD